MENPYNHQKIEVLCAGEALMDLVADQDGKLKPCMGGAVFNLTRALALQGIDVAYINPLSSDVYGQQLRKQLVRDGAVVLDTNPLPHPTSLALVTVDDEGKAAYAFYREGVADRATSSERLNQLSQSQDIQVVCTGCLALSPEDAEIYLPWLQEQQKLKRTIAIDVNVRAALMKDPITYQANIYKALQYANMIKVSDDDLTYLDISAEQLLSKTNADMLLLTLGAKGAQVLTREGKRITAPAPLGLRVLDTVGAGDCFFAGFIAAWFKHHGELQTALNHAIRCASINCTRLGCQPPTWSEVIHQQAT